MFPGREWTTFPQLQRDAVPEKAVSATRSGSATTTNTDIPDHTHNPSGRLCRAGMYPTVYLPVHHRTQEKWGNGGKPGGETGGKRGKTGANRWKKGGNRGGKWGKTRGGMGPGRSGCSTGCAIRIFAGYLLALAACCGAQCVVLICDHGLCIRGPPLLPFKRPPRRGEAALRHPDLRSSAVLLTYHRDGSESTRFLLCGVGPQQVAAVTSGLQSGEGVPQRVHKRGRCQSTADRLVCGRGRAVLKEVHSCCSCIPRPPPGAALVTVKVPWAILQPSLWV